MSEKGAKMDNIALVWDLPQPPIHGCCSSRDNLGDENPRIIRNMGIVNTSCDAEAQARVPLHTISMQNFINRRTKTTLKQNQTGKWGLQGGFKASVNLPFGSTDISDFWLWFCQNAVGIFPFACVCECDKWYRWVCKTQRLFSQSWQMPFNTASQKVDIICKVGKCDFRAFHSVRTPVASISCRSGPWKWWELVRGQACLWQPWPQRQAANTTAEKSPHFIIFYY